METYLIKIVNDRFTARDEKAFPDQRTAKHEAIKGALAIGSEQVMRGQDFFAAEVSIEKAGQLLERHVVSLGLSCLQRA